jgi:hypothetical protein
MCRQYSAILGAAVAIQTFAERLIEEEAKLTIGAQDASSSVCGGRVIDEDDRDHPR